MIGGDVIEGRENIIQLFEQRHRGIREIKNPKLVLHQGRDIFAEIDMEVYDSLILLRKYHSFVEEKNSFLGPVNHGTRVTMKCFALYRLNDENRFESVKIMNWPPGFGVTPMPRLGGSQGQKIAFLSYIDAINHGAFETLSQFYHHEVSDNTPGTEVIHGREALVEFIKGLHKEVEIAAEVRRIIADDNAIYAEIVSTITAIQDGPTLRRDMKKGETGIIKYLCVYELREGLIYKVDVTPCT